MKESKKFFDNNRLNKGYSKLFNSRQSDSSIIGDKYKHVLPPIDMIEEYEELYPGVFQKLVDMTKQEQNHRHSVDLLTIEKHSKAMRMGRMCAIILTAIIAITTLMLAVLNSNILVAAAFAASAFACITIITYVYSKNTITKNFTRNYSPRVKQQHYSKDYSLLQKNRKRS